MWLRRLCVAIAVLALAPCSAEAGTPKGVELYTMDCGRITTSDADLYADDGAYKGVAETLVVPCYLIRHPKGDLLWETGLPEAIAGHPVVDGPERMEVGRKLTDQLKQLGLSPAEIEYVAVSHSHFDHIGNGGLFAGSTWIVNARERAYAFRPAARADTKAFAAYAALERARTVLIEGEAPYDVFGDGTAVIYPAPGHTPGHSVLLVRPKQAGPVLLAGDMWHVAESRPARRVPRFNTDRVQTLQSMDRVEKLAADTGARVVLEHVPADFDALPRFPEPLR